MVRVVLRTRTEREKPLPYNQEATAIRLGDFVQIKLLTCASVEKTVFNQATVLLLRRLADRRFSSDHS